MSWKRSREVLGKVAGCVVPVLCLALGCRVGKPAVEDFDAATTRGAGLPDRILTDAALWAEVGGGDRAPNDGAAPTPGPSDGRREVSDATDAGDGVSMACNLFDNGCPLEQGCYTDEAFSGRTICLAATAGITLDRFPCQVQNDCAPGEICFALTGTGRVCLQLCHTDISRLPGGSCLDLVSIACVPLPHYAGIGYCR